MGITLVLKLVSSEVNPGFTVWLQVINDSQGVCLLERVGHLPADHQLEDLYHHWQTRFRSLIHQGRNGPDTGWDFDDIPRNLSSDSDLYACRNYIRLLEENMERWLKFCTDQGWQEIQQQIPFYLGKHSEEVRLVIQSDSQLWKLPWLAWNLLKLEPNSGKQELGIGFSPVEYQKLETVIRGERPGNSVRILAVFGSGENLDLEPDRMALEQLTDAEVEILNEPSGRELIEKIRDEQGWDIFCFSGHSQTKGRDGILYINQTQSLELREFQEALKIAIRRGLKLAIFNSCDGLGLAEKLARLNLPVAIVMKEPVPDAVAQCFLKGFLSEYAAGVPLYTAVRRSQIQLESFHDEFPGCSSLPIICQNPAEVPPTWAELSQGKPGDVFDNPVEINKSKRGKRSAISQLRSIWKNRRLLAGVSLLVAGVVIVVRLLGLLQIYELQAFDHLMQQRRPYEYTDKRILIVKASDQDIQEQEELETPPNKASLSDHTLVQLFKKLEKFEPETIALDIYRDFAVDPRYPELISYLQQSNLFAICKLKASKNGNRQGIKPPPEISENQIVFSDALPDPDKVLRRHLLAKYNNLFTDKCTAKNHISLITALHYLSRKGFDYQHKNDLQETIVVNNVSFKQLTSYTGGYQRLDAGGRQILLNYRVLENLKEIAHVVNIGDIINDKITPSRLEDLKHKIVLIGIDANRATSNDYWLTPARSNQPKGQREIAGIYIVAHMVSQLISAVLDNRPLLWVWPLWAEIFWIWIWAMWGTFMGFLIRSPLYLGISISGSLAVLYGICYLLICQAGWIPLIPSAIALILSTWGIILATYPHKNYRV